ncbi:hypothetical protein ACFHW2_12240 [Actinomadura sp. LOL_016]|uniref:hypothetical protein n=1 Tax=unclassified Actinomadura TaxID=2626254 RepID=UPI003A7FCC12
MTELLDRVQLTRTEYAVRTGDDIVVLDDEALMRQTLAEFIADGRRAEPVVRTVTEWQIDETAAARARRDVAREAILATAQRYWEGETSVADALDELRPHHATLAYRDRARLLGELVSELEHAEAVDEHRVDPGPGQDRRTLEEDAERRVNEAADALYGGGR